jgi:hypothetical protein
MANILLRSPFYVYQTQSGAQSAKLELEIDGTLRYTIIKDTPTTSVTFEIAQLARDYLDITYGGSYQNQSVDISGEITWYQSTNATGGTTGTPVTFTHKGFDGYWDYYNTSYTKEFCSTGSCLMQDNTTIYVPEGKGGFIPVLSSGSIIYNSFTGSTTTLSVGSPPVTITIKRQDCSKYMPMQITFVNKYGALQDLYFDKKSTETMVTTSEKYNNSNISSSGTYSVTSHQYRTLSKSGREKMTLNTGFIDEGMNEVMKQLMLSEQVWMHMGSEIHPIDIASNSLTFKTKVNDKLINYTIEVEHAHEHIDRVR